MPASCKSSSPACAPPRTPDARRPAADTAADLAPTRPPAGHATATPSSARRPTLPPGIPPLGPAPLATRPLAAPAPARHARRRGSGIAGPRPARAVDSCRRRLARPGAGIRPALPAPAPATPERATRPVGPGAAWFGQAAPGGQAQTIAEPTRGQILGRHLVQHRGRVRQQAGRARQMTTIVRQRRFQLRQQALAQQIAPPALVPIAFILHPAQALGLNPGLQLQPAQAQQRPPQPGPRRVQPTQRRHRRQRARAAAAQQLQQHGFRLIVQMMRQRHHPGGGAPIHLVARRAPPLPGYRRR